MRGDEFDVVTGAFGYTGRSIASQLLERGRRVTTLTGHPNRPNPFGDRVSVAPMDFRDPAGLREHLQGAETLYTTYWVRFPRGEVTFERAVANSATLFEAAREAGVGRIVHVSITNPSGDSPFPYFRGKAAVERLLAASGLPYAIVRPTVVFGERDILINNIAYVLRRLPVFGVPGSGEYRLRPVAVEDVAELCIRSAEGEPGSVLDAVGPETYTFEGLVRLIARTIGSRSRIVHVPPTDGAPGGLGDRTGRRGRRAHPGRARRAHGRTHRHGRSRDRLALARGVAAGERGRGRRSVCLRGLAALPVRERVLANAVRRPRPA